MTNVAKNYMSFYEKTRIERTALKRAKREIRNSGNKFKNEVIWEFKAK